MKVERIGPQHQAGSDSLLTLTTFMALLKKHFGARLESVLPHASVLYGLGKDANRGGGAGGENGAFEGVAV